MTQVFRISNSLREAFFGWHEAELRQAHEAAFHGIYADFPSDHATFEEFVYNEVATLIICATPEERLRVYLEWNGILGFTQTIYSIAIGRLA